METSPASSEAQVRMAKESDAAQIAVLASQLGYPSTTEEILHRMRSLEPPSQHVLFVAESPAGEVVGWGHVERTDRCRRTAQPGCRPEAPRTGRALGARARLQVIKPAFQRGPNPGASVLRAAVLRALQNSESLSQNSVAGGPDRPSRIPGRRRASVGCEVLLRALLPNTIRFQDILQCHDAFQFVYVRTAHDGERVESSRAHAIQSQMK